MKPTKHQRNTVWTSKHGNSSPTMMTYGILTNTSLTTMTIRKWKKKQTGTIGTKTRRRKTKMMTGRRIGMMKWNQLEIYDNNKCLFNTITVKWNYLNNIIHIKVWLIIIFNSQNLIIMNQYNHSNPKFIIRDSWVNKYIV